VRDSAPLQRALRFRLEPGLPPWLRLYEDDAPYGLEAAFSRALGDTQALEIVGQTLRLMGEDSNETARLRAVYTPF